jgi:hypothetical protein
VRAGPVLLAACLAAVTIGSCRLGGCAPLPPQRRVEAPIPIDAVDRLWSGVGWVRYTVHRTTPATAPASNQRMVLRFTHPLHGARLHVSAVAPNGLETLAFDRRADGDVVDLPLGATTWDNIHVVVHYHLRRAAILEQAVVLAEVPRAPAR